MSNPQAKTIMTNRLTTITPEDRLDKAQLLMSQLKIRHLPVVDTTGALVGMLGDRDVRTATRPGDGSFNPKAKVKDFMSWPAHCVSESTSLLEVVHRMLSDKISAVVVLGSDQLAHGIVTTDDLLRYLAKLLGGSDDTKSRTVGWALKEYGWIGPSA